MSVAKVLEYSMTYKTLTKDFKEKTESGYELCLSLVLAEEYGEGFGAKNINNPTRNGTKIKFEAFKNGEEAEKYAERLKVMAAEAKKGFDKQLAEQVIGKEESDQIKMEG